MYLFINTDINGCVGIANNMEEARETANRITHVDMMRGVIGHYKVVQRGLDEKGGVIHMFGEFLNYGA